MSKYEQIQNCSIAKDKFLIQFIDLSIDISKYEMLLLLHTNIIKWRRTKIKIYVAVGVFFYCYQHMIFFIDGNDEKKNFYWFSLFSYWFFYLNVNNIDLIDMIINQKEILKKSNFWKSYDFFKLLKNLIGGELVLTHL